MKQYGIPINFHVNGESRAEAARALMKRLHDSGLFQDQGSGEKPLVFESWEPIVSYDVKADNGDMENIQEIGYALIALILDGLKADARNIHTSPED